MVLLTSKPNFEDTLNPSCSCSIEAEATLFPLVPIFPDFENVKEGTVECILVIFNLLKCFFFYILFFHNYLLIVTLNHSYC